MKDLYIDKRQTIELAAVQQTSIVFSYSNTEVRSCSFRLTAKTLKLVSINKYSCKKRSLVPSPSLVSQPFPPPGVTESPQQARSVSGEI